VPTLGLDTATSRGSVALEHGSAVAAQVDLAELHGHARDLLDTIDRLLRSQGLGPRDLLGIGVAAGPGSFTGVRVGMATAKGLCYSLQIGLLAISTLESLARAAMDALPGGSDLICPVLGAGRGEVYAALFRVEAAGLVRCGPDRPWSPDDLAREIPPVAVLVGDGAGLVLGAAGGASRIGAVLDPAPRLAGTIALRAGAVLAGTPGYRPGEAGPNYVRPSDAKVTRPRS